MKRGSTNISNPKRGSTDIQKIFRGTDLVWSRGITLDYILVSNSTTSSGTVALQKWDKDGNVVASITFGQVGVPPSRQILSETDDNNFYYTAIVNSDIIRYRKLNTDLTINTSVNITTKSDFTFVDILAPGSGIDRIISSDNDSNLPGYELITKSFVSVSGSYVERDGRGSLFRISDYSTTPFKFCLVSPADGMSVITTDGSTFTTIWNNTGTNYDNVFFVYNPSTNEAVAGDATNGIYFSDIDSSTIVALSNFRPSLRFGGLFSNGDVLYVEGTNIRRRTWSNILANSTTNVWSFSLSNVVWMDIDQDDNFYVVISTTTNGFRKYDSSGTLTWQRNLPAAGFGGGLAHK